MIQVQNGQCGLCIHFGEHHSTHPTDQLIQIRMKHQAPEDLVEECGHPQLERLHLVVTPISGCAGFAPAPEASQSAP